MTKTIPVSHLMNFEGDLEFLVTLYAQRNQQLDRVRFHKAEANDALNSLHTRRAHSRTAVAYHAASVAVTEQIDAYVNSFTTDVNSIESIKEVAQSMAELMHVDTLLTPVIQYAASNVFSMFDGVPHSSGHHLTTLGNSIVALENVARKLKLAMVVVESLIDFFKRRRNNA